MKRHSPKNCPKCGRFAGCENHFYSFGILYTYEYFCKICKLNFSEFAELEVVLEEEEDGSSM